jgi:hypothetical protein
MAVTPLELLANDGGDDVVMHATGFVYKNDNQYFLVSARHVFSGRDTFTDKIISDKGYIPERIRLRLISTLEDQRVLTTTIIISLLNDGKPTWLQDPEFESLRTDIAVIPLPAPQPGVSPVFLDVSPIAYEIVTVVGFDCSIVGYPSRNLEGLMTPIWRRGSLASEPLLPVDRKPMFLVDAVTGPGFSGAPVLRRQIGPLATRDDDGQVSVQMDRVLTTSLIGVYSGRVLHPSGGGEVPYAFYANRIPLILKSGK